MNPTRPRRSIAYSVRLARTLAMLVALSLVGALLPGISVVYAIQPTLTNGQNATLVIGQPNFTSNTATNPTQSGTGQPNDVAVDLTTGKIFVVDRTNNRVLRFGSLASLSNGANAEGVLGQPNFTSGAAATTQSGMSFPLSIAFDNTGRLWVIDSSNSRVLRFDNAASKPNGANADGVLGQANFTSATQTTTQSGMWDPYGLALDNTGRLWVADQRNNRVLRFDNAASKANGANADGVLGQANFTSGSSATTQSRMRAPLSVSVDNAGRLWVADKDNNRALRFDNAASKANGANADGVLGQANFTSSTQATTQNGMYNPYDVQMDTAGRLYVADTYNHRAIWFDNAASKANGANADGVLGQANFTSGSNATTQSRMFFPQGVGMDGNNQVWVADTYNSRALYFGPLVSANADLSNLALSSGTLSPAFVDTTTSYTANVASNVSSITVTPTVADADATVTVNGVATTSGSPSGAIALAVGTNTITIVVTAADGTTTKTTTVTVTRATPVTTSVSVSATPSSITSGGSATSAIAATVRDQNNEPMAGVLVSFNVPSGGGSVSPTTSSTDANGVATTTYTAGSAAGSAVVRATANGGVYGETTITLVNDPPVLSVSDSGSYNAGTAAVVVAPTLTITDDNDENVSGAQVSITASFGASTDRLGISGQGSATSGTVGSLSWFYDTTSGVLTFSGIAPVSTFQAVLRQVTFYTTGSPTLASRTVLFVLGSSLPQISDDATVNVIDTIAPVAPVISSPAPGSTTSNRPAFGGTAEPGSTVKVTDNGVTICTTTVASDGSWSCTATSDVTNGAHTVSVTVTDGAGNISPPAQVGFTVDATKPDAPVISVPVEGARTGKRPVFSGTAEAGATVTVSEGNTSYCTAVATGGTWSCTVTFDLIEGVYDVAAVARDSVGNVSQPSPVRSFVVDLTAPIAPTITGPAIGEVVNKRPTFTGIGEPGATVKVTDNGVVVCTTIVATDGTWICTPTSDLVDGAHTITAIAIDNVGNTSEPSEELTYTVDAIAPPAPIINTPTDTGLVGKRPVFSGTGEDGAVVEVSENGVVLCITTVVGGGWNCKATADLDDGPHTVTAKATDSVGNVSVISTSRNFTVDTAQPQAPVITSPTITSNNKPTIAGTAAPGLTVRLQLDLDGDNTFDVTYTTTSGPDGAWSVDTATATPTVGSIPTTGLADRSYTMVAVTISAASIESQETGQTLTIDTTKPAAPTITSPAEASDAKPFFTGTAEPNITVTVGIDLNGDGSADVIYVVKVNSAGFWSVDTETQLPASGSLPAGGLADGSYIVTATARDAAGNVGSPTSQTLKVTLEAFVPPTITILLKGYLIKPGLIGTAMPNHRLRVRLSQGASVTTQATNEVEYMISASANGAWQIDSTRALPSSGKVPVAGYKAGSLLYAEVTDLDAGVSAGASASANASVKATYQVLLMIVRK